MRCVKPFTIRCLSRLRRSSGATPDNRDRLLSDLLKLLGQKPKSGDLVEAYREYYLKFGNHQMSTQVLQQLFPVLSTTQDKMLLKAAWNGILDNKSLPRATCTMAYIKAFKDEITLSEIKKLPSATLYVPNVLHFLLNLFSKRSLVADCEELIAMMLAHGKVHHFDAWIIHEILVFALRNSKFDELKSFLVSLRAKFGVPPFSALEQEKHLVYQVIETLHEIKVEANQHIYSLLIQIYIKIGSSQKENQNPIGLLDEMEADRIVLTIPLANELVMLFALFGDTADVVFLIFDIMQEELITPDSQTFMMLFTGWTKTASTVESNHLFRIINRISELGVQLSPHCLVALLNLVTKLGYNENTRQIVKLIMSINTPSVVNYTILIRFFARMNDQESIQKCLSEIQERQVVLDLPAYDVLIDHYISQMNVLEVRNLVSRMKATYVSLDETLFARLVNFFILHSRMKEDVRDLMLYSSQLKKSKFRSAFFYNALLSAHVVLQSKKEEFDEVLYLMRRDKVSPDARTWDCRINFTRGRASLKEMSELLDEMIEQDAAPLRPRAFHNLILQCFGSTAAMQSEKLSQYLRKLNVNLNGDNDVLNVSNYSELALVNLE